ncbi:MAG: 2-oxo acid dehydrogenase subunit E2 [Chloroflexi bacterium]|nr:2-oxo acid dehydrogenase subunit E2 [Chloroflexota bacterium]
MPTEIVMPRLSDTMSEGTVAKWRKQVGDRLAKGDTLVEIETDKATMELEVFEPGVLGRILVPEGQMVPVGVPIALVLAAGEELPAEQAAPTAPTSAPTAAPAAAPPQATGLALAPDAPPEAQPPPAAGRVRASPLARRLAEEQGVDLSRVAGTGPDGRVTREDVEAFLQRPAAEQAPTPEVAPTPLPVAAAAFPGLVEEEELVPLSTMQRTIVARMLESKAASPHFYVTSEIDMAEAVAFRRSLNEALGEGQGATVNDLVVKAVALALRQHPDANAAYRDGQMVRFKHVHVGIAVAVPNGLVVPVIRHADQKSLRQIASEARELVEKARNRRLTIQEMEGSTFSVTNLGMYGVDQFTGIINQPNAAILAVGAIVRKPVVKEEQIVISDRMRVTLSVDHRVFYGATAAEFLRDVKSILEHPLRLVL